MGFTLREILGATVAARVEAHVEAPVSTCPTGKTSYRTKAEADKALARISHHQTRMRRYRCPFCDQLHLGHRRGTV